MKSTYIQDIKSKVLYNKLYQSLENIFELSKVHQEYIINSNLYKYHNALSFLHDYCTIKLAGPRQCGHSHALIKLFREKCLYGPIFYPNLDIAHLFYKEVENIQFLTFNNILNHKVKDYKRLTNCFAVDCATYLNKEQLDNLYIEASIYFNFDKPFFILLIE